MTQHRPLQEDPEPPDENDPEFKEEMFETYKEMGWRPEDLKNPQDAEEYAAWLKERS